MESNDDSEEPDVQSLLDEEVRKPYYGVSYLDDFKLPYEKLDVSAVVSTHNRCPYDPKGDKGNLNPLAWCIKSLLLQEPKLKEIIIVDDRSEDFTKQVVESFKREAKKKGAGLFYIKNKDDGGNTTARNAGAKKANSKYLFFTDDDCIMTPYSAFGGVYTFEEIEKDGVKLAVVNLSTYQRTSQPEKAVPKKEIGSVSFIKGVYTTNKNSFPIEYLNGNTKSSEEKFMENEWHILNPFPIQNLNAYCICSKKAFEEIGGFKKHVITRGEDREFGAELIENGYQIYFQPDPKFHSVHGSYGLKLKKKFNGPDWFQKHGLISLKNAMKECDKPNTKSGMRISTKEYVFDAILSFFCLVYPRNKKGAIKWIEKVYSEFVKEGNTSIFGNINVSMPDMKERENLWRKAISIGLSYLISKEREEVSNINEAIVSLKEKGEENQDVLNIIEQL